MTQRLGHAGEMYDPWIFLSYIAAHTKEIALGTTNAVTSFQHPLNLAKSAASLDRVSRERVLLGLATDDRPVEFDVFGVNREERTKKYREILHVMREAWSTSFPTIHTKHVVMAGNVYILQKSTLG